MTQAAPEFSRLLRRDEWGRSASVNHISAIEAERAALATRFSLLAIDLLEADYSLATEGDNALATGTVRAVVKQSCVATGQPVPAVIEAPFTIRFVPEASSEPQTGEEIELDAEECDIVEYSEGRIDIGEAIAETLALAMNPFPRSPDADEYLRAMGVQSEEEAQAQSSPFAALKKLSK